jgi:CheY-like chemotaxis protein
MLIEDSLDDAFALQRAFARVGFAEPLTHFTNPEKAIACLMGQGEFADREKHPLPEIVFLDLNMPRVDGFHVLRWIKSQPHLGRVIIIVITAVQDLKLIKLAYQLGAHSFLSKDANDEELANVVRFLRDYSRIAYALPRLPEENGSSNTA